MKALPVIAGAAGMAFVGGSVAVSGHLDDAPVFTVQALRYTVACLLLLAWAYRSRIPAVLARRTSPPTPARSSTPAAAVANARTSAVAVARSAVPAVVPARPGASAVVAARSGASVTAAGRSGSPALAAARSGSPAVAVDASRHPAASGTTTIRDRVPVRWPRGFEWWWLLGVTVTGLLIFNIALVQGSRHAEPAVIGVAVACVPIILAVAGPFLEGRRPAARVLTAAVVVTAGAALVQGLGRTDATGVLWAAVTFGCEAAFTLLAMPVLGRHGPLGVSVHATWMGAVMFAVLGLAVEGPGAVMLVRADDLLAGAYLAVLVTAVAFLLWYTCVARIGAGRAGLLAGVTPIAAAVTGVLLGGPPPAPLVWLGTATVAAGLSLGLTTPKSV
jgi:drug/metabolite transporter (DMT)-like permease